MAFYRFIIHTLRYPPSVEKKRYDVSNEWAVGWAGSEISHYDSVALCWVNKIHFEYILSRSHATNIASHRYNPQAADAKIEIQAMSSAYTFVELATMKWERHQQHRARIMADAAACTDLIHSVTLPRALVSA